MGCVCVYVQKVELLYWWEYDDEKTRIKNTFLKKYWFFGFQGLGQTATNIVQVAKDEHEQKGVTGAVGGVLRQVPATVVQPFILATEATSSVLGGVRNQILPDARREAAEKWRASP